jgi:precorrin-3B synthase
MRDLVKAVGAHAVFAEAGLDAPASAQAMRAAPRAIGHLAIGGGPRDAFGIGLPFGQLEAPAFAALAALAEQYGDGTVRVTPWRAVVIAGVARSDAPALAAAAAEIGLIVDAADARLSIAACPGKPSCASATVETRADAARLAALHKATGGLVHVSGCAKGCAHPGPADATLVGSLGRYGVVLGGTAKDQPIAAGLTIDAAISVIERHCSGRRS